MFVALVVAVLGAVGWRAEAPLPSSGLRPRREREPQL